jgi:hypothetical protein
MSDLVQRLRDHHSMCAEYPIRMEAADRIEALEAALRYISEAYGVPNDLKQIAIRALESKHE